MSAEFSQIVECISENICNEIFSFTGSLNELTSSASSLEIYNPQDPTLQKMYSNLEPTLEKHISDVHVVLRNHLDKVQEKENDIVKLKTQRQKAETKIGNQEKSIQRLQKECELYEQKLAELQKSKDCVKACKVLTGSNFVLKKDRTLGCILLRKILRVQLNADPYKRTDIKTRQTYEVFEYNNKIVNPNDITTAVWNLVENFVTEDK